MAFQKQKFREIVFQMLYSYDISKVEDQHIQALLMKELAVPKKQVLTATERVHQLLKHLEEIDKLIASISVSYDFDRIQTVERNILRLAIFEMIYDKEIPPKVAMAEAIRLSRKFATPESASFINALLDQIYQAGLQESSDNQPSSNSQIPQHIKILLKNKAGDEKA